MLELPSDTDLERELTAPLLQRILVTLILAGLALSAVSTTADFHKALYLALANTSIAGAMLSLAKRGHVHTASIVVVLSLLLTTVHAMSTGEGLYDDSLLIVPGIYFVSSLLLRPRWVLAIIVLTLLAVVGVGIAQLRGYVGANGNKEPFSYHYVLEVVILLGALATFVHHIVRLMRRSIVEARLAHESVRDILDATSEAIVICNADNGGVVSVNATAQAMFGYSRAEFLGLAPNALMMTPEPDGARFANACAEARSGKNVLHLEWQARRKDGSKFWVEVAIGSARISGQQRLIAVARDITRRRRLEQRVREAEMFRAVGQLAGGVAHDFNNQLVGILGNAEFLRDEVSVDADLSACADAIIASGRRAADLTQQLLAFARRGRLRNVAVDVHQLIAEVIALGKRSIDKRISIEQQLEATQYTVLGDPSALQNALLNLLLNARDALPHGGVIRFTTRLIDGVPVVSQPQNKLEKDGRSSDDAIRTLLRARGATQSETWSRCDSAATAAGTAIEEHLEITVTDNGTGIEPAIAERIFEPFFTTKEHGTGMGLAAVRGTLDEHRGSIELLSETGRGTTFRLLLPLHHEQVKAVPTPAREEQVQAAGRILVVDDEAAVANVCKLALEHGGFQVDVCSGGRQALERCKAVQFDLILLDVMMPDIDGVEVLRVLRTTDPSARVLLMTGSASESVEARLKEWTDIVVLSKPMMPKEILESVRRQLTV